MQEPALEWLHSARLNGIQQRWADTATCPSERLRPAILFLHGWPECWFSWRAQLRAVRAAGYRGIAPDMRGYGGTEAPAHYASYSVYTLAADVLALLQHLGVRRAALVGHDHGANLGWKLALLHPRVFPCYCAMSVPYNGRPKRAPIASLRARFGDRFNYQLHHQLPEAAAQYEVDPRAALLAVWGGSPPSEAGPPPVTSKLMYVDGVAEPLWRRLPQPKRPPPWLSCREVDYFVGCFRQSGFAGGLNWYRVMDLDWHATPQLEGRKVQQPVAFVCGVNDVVLRWFGGRDGVMRDLPRACGLPPNIHFLDAGHWVQQEQPDQVNSLLLDFVGEHRATLQPDGCDASCTDWEAGASMPSKL